MRNLDKESVYINITTPNLGDITIRGTLYNDGYDYIIVDTSGDTIFRIPYEYITEDEILYKDIRVTISL